MIRSPLHLLISLQRFLYRTKARHKSAFIFSRPITKSASWSAAIALRIPRTSTQISVKSIPTSVQQETYQLLRMTQRQSPMIRRMLISRQSPRQCHAAVYVQSRTMLSSGNTTNHQVTTVMNAAQFFTPRPPILGVHGGILPPPTPQSSLRSYVNHPPWAHQQYQQAGLTSPLSPSSAEIDIDDIDSSREDGSYNNNTRYHHQHINQRLSTNTTSIAATHHTSCRQQSYRPPNMRGMADLMEDDSGSDKSNAQMDTDGTVYNRHSPGLVHRGQPPRKWSPRQKQQPASSTTTRRMLAMNVLRHDDLSLQTTNKRRSSASTSSAIDPATPTSTTVPDDDDSNHFLDSTQQWYISIPMDLAFLMQPGGSSLTPTFSSATSSPAAGSLFSMEHAVSVLDPVWMKSLDQWGKLIRCHLTKVMVLIRLVGLEAQRYYANGRQCNTVNSDSTGRDKYDDHSGYSGINVDEAETSTHSRITATAGATAVATTMDFKMMMMKKANTPSELRIYLPHHLCTPLPTTPQNIQRWVNRLVRDPPCFEIKYGTKDTGSDDGTTHYNDDSVTAMMDGNLFEVPTGDMDNVDRGMDMDDLAEHDNSDGDPWHIGPLYFQGIHSFLNHVDTMIDSSPAFATGGQRRFSL